MEASPCCIVLTPVFSSKTVGLAWDKILDKSTRCIGHPGDTAVVDDDLHGLVGSFDSAKGTKTSLRDAPRAWMRMMMIRRREDGALSERVRGCLDSELTNTRAHGCFRDSPRGGLELVDFIMVRHVALPHRKLAGLNCEVPPLGRVT